MSGAAVGGKLNEGGEQLFIFFVAGSFRGNTVFDYSSEGGNAAFFAYDNFGGFESVAMDKDGVIDPGEEFVGVKFKMSEGVPAAEITMEDIEGEGEGKVLSSAAEAGGSDKAEGGFLFWSGGGLPKFFVGGGR